MRSINEKICIFIKHKPSHSGNCGGNLKRVFYGGRNMVIGLNNNYGYDKHELATKVEDNFEYAGTDTRKGITYDCYLVPDGITYKAVCVERK